MSTRMRDTVRRSFSNIMRKRRDSSASISSVSSNNSTFEGPFSLSDSAKQIWRLPTGSLSIHLDAPRICQRAIIIAKDGTAIFNGNESERCIDALLKMILAMNQCFPEDPLHQEDEEIQEVFNNHVTKEEGDIGEQFLGFLQSGVINEKSQLCSMLKLATLDVAAPCIYRLRDTLYDKYPYRGINGSWGLQFVVDSNQVLVTHSKKERSVSDVEGEKFDFSWKSSLIWMIESDRLQVTINVTGLGYDDEMKFRNRKEIRDLLDSFVDEANAYRLIWDRPIKRQPIHKDIVRLCSRLKIVHEKDGVVHEPKDDDSVPTFQVVYEILEKISKYTKEETLHNEIKSKYFEYIRQDGDTSEQILKFFLSKGPQDEPRFSESSCLVRILKCINQEILFPAVMTLRANIYEQFPFKDVKGGWNVVVNLGETTCSVTHIKKEQSHGSNENYFEFEWVLKCIMSIDDPEIFKPNMKIVNYDWNNRTNAETRKKVLDGLMSFIEQNIMYQRILNKQMAKMSLHSDIVRFLRKDALVIQKGGEPIFEYLGNNDEVQEVQKVLNLLIKYLNDQESQKLMDEHFTEYVKGGVGLSEQLKNFFSQDNDLFNDNLPLVTLLKCISSDMYFPAYLNLRNTFFSVFPFRDVKGTGKLVITFSTSEEIQAGGPLFTVSHRKKEQSSSTFPSEYFEFEWELSLRIYDLEQKTIQSQLSIVSFNFNDQTFPDFKQDIITAWSPFLPESLKKTHHTAKKSKQKTFTLRSKKRFSQLKTDEIVE